jgi:hypothetical protein
VIHVFLISFEFKQLNIITAGIKLYTIKRINSSSSFYNAGSSDSNRTSESLRESLRSLADFLAEDVDAALWVVLYALPHHLYVLGMEIISDVGARTVLAYAAISVNAAHPGTDHQQGHHEDHE